MQALLGELLGSFCLVAEHLSKYEQKEQTLQAFFNALRLAVSCPTLLFAKSSKEANFENMNTMLKELILIHKTCAIFF